MRRMLLLVAVAGGLLLAVPAHPQVEGTHRHGGAETLGTVHFPTSCRPEVAARWALERRDWPAAAALELPAVELPWPQYPYVPAITYFSRAIGTARSGQLERAREALGKLQQVQSGLATSPPPGPYDWAGHVESLRLAAAGILERVEGRDGEAVLLETDRAAEALAEYEAALREAPNRFNSLAGAARAAARAGQAGRAGELYARLLEMTVEGAPRPEVREARRFVAATK